MKRLFIAFLSVFLLVSVFSVANEAAGGTEYPVKRIECIIPTGAGGDGDILGRKVLEGVTARLGQPIVVVNKSGAAGSIGYRTLAGAKPDGYTIGLAFVTLFMNKMRGIQPFDHHDFTLIAQHGSFTPIIVASTKSEYPFKTIGEAVSFAKTHPGEVKFALSVLGGSWWTAGKAFQTATKVEFKNIPQEGAGAVVVAQLAGGHADLGVAGLASALSQLAAGNLRFLATFGLDRPSGKYSNVPTLIESGFDVTWDSPNYFIGPPGMPKDVTQKLTKAFEVEANKPEFKKFVVNMNATPIYRGPDQLVKYLDRQKEVSREVMLKAGILKEK